MMRADHEIHGATIYFNATSIDRIISELATAISELTRETAYSNVEVSTTTMTLSNISSFPTSIIPKSTLSPSRTASSYYSTTSSTSSSTSSYKSSLTTAPVSSTCATRSIASATSTVAATSSSTAAALLSDTGSNSSKLSPGASVGVTVGAIAGISLLATLLYFIWRLRDRQQANQESTSMPPASSTYQPLRPMMLGIPQPSSYSPPNPWRRPPSTSPQSLQSPIVPTPLESLPPPLMAGAWHQYPTVQSAGYTLWPNTLGPSTKYSPVSPLVQRDSPGKAIHSRYPLKSQAGPSSPRKKKEKVRRALLKNHDHTPLEPVAEDSTSDSGHSDDSLENYTYHKWI